MRSYLTPLLLVLTAILLGGASYYVTDVEQKGRIETLRESRRAAELMTARVEDLLVQESTSAESASLALSRWHSRYKYIPREMNTADVLEYLEGLSRTGFESFDLKLTGQTTTPDFNKISWDVKGEGLYSAIYHVVWHLENNREFYRIFNLNMEHVEVTDPDGGPTRDLVQFGFRLEAFYGGLEGISAPEEDLAPIPVGLLLPHTTSNDIFRPQVRVPKDAPSTAVEAPSAAEVRGPTAPAPAAGEAPRAAPTRPDGLDIQRSTLVLILGSEALFRDDWDREFRVKLGDEVEDGEIVLIDARNGAVHAKVKDGDTERLVVRTLGDRTGR